MNNTKMNPQVKEWWVKALRSKEYTQIYGALHAGTGFCIYGVLCDLYRKKVLKKGKDKVWKQGSVRYGFTNPEYKCGMTPEVQKWAGFKYPDVYLYDENDKLLGSLMTMNDGYNYTFERIADIIERFL